MKPARGVTDACRGFGDLLEGAAYLRIDLLLSNGGIPEYKCEGGREELFHVFCIVWIVWEGITWVR